MFLLYIGQTTTEHLRKVFADRQNPYNQGFLGNCTRICCQGSNHPSLLPDQTEEISEEVFFSHNQRSSATTVGGSSGDYSSSNTSMPKYAPREGSVAVTPPSSSSSSGGQSAEKTNLQVTPNSKTGSPNTYGSTEKR